MAVLLVCLIGGTTGCKRTPPTYKYPAKVLQTTTNGLSISASLIRNGSNEPFDVSYSVVLHARRATPDPEANQDCLIWECRGPGPDQLPLLKWKGNEVLDIEYYWANGARLSPNLTVTGPDLEVLGRIEINLVRLKEPK